MIYGNTTKTIMLEAPLNLGNILNLESLVHLSLKGGLKRKLTIYDWIVKMDTKRSKKQWSFSKF